MKTRICLVVLIACMSIGIQAQNTTDIRSIRDWRQQNEHRILSEYISFVSIPNIASDKPSLLKTATTIKDMMSSSGIQNVQLLYPETKDAPPAVFGEVLTPGATETIIIYAHYDGQPVNTSNWFNGLEPFIPKLASGVLGKDHQWISLDNIKPIDPEWRLYGRSSSDDKAGVIAIINAYKALKASGKTPGVNIKFFFEGEEEAGSDHLHEIFMKYKPLLSSDFWIICDGPVHQSGRKTVVFGVRGDTHLELTIYGPTKPLHSGHYGNWVSSPAWQLVQLLSTMKNDKGEVTINGFYDDVKPLSEAEKKALAAIPPVEEQMKKQLGIQMTERNVRINEAYNFPTLNINGIRSADVGELSANIIPVKATVSLDLRLVAGNDWKRQQDKVIRHIQAQGYYVKETAPTDEDRMKYPKLIEVKRSGGYNAQKTDLNLPQAQKVLKAVQSTTMEPVVIQPTSGGSLPLFIFENYLQAKTITIPIANHDNNQHAENENIRIRNFWEGIETMAAIMLMK